MNGCRDHGIGALVRKNPYPGRGIAVGQSRDGRRAVFAYFIMGRSENSRNRIFVEQGDDVVIHPYRPDKLIDPSLIIYAPVRMLGNRAVVTNGDQTDTICAALAAGGTFEQALETRTFEPDAPNFTPRISALLTLDGTGFTYKMSILKSADPAGRSCSRFTFSYEPLPGAGHFLHTYLGDGSPLPSFAGEPERFALPEGLDAFASGLWEDLDRDNRISLYVRTIDLATGETQSRMINKNG